MACKKIVKNKSRNTTILRVFTAKEDDVILGYLNVGTAVVYGNLQRNQLIGNLELTRDIYDGSVVQDYLYSNPSDFKKRN